MQVSPKCEVVSAKSASGLGFGEGEQDLQKRLTTIVCFFQLRALCCFMEVGCLHAVCAGQNNAINVRRIVIIGSMALSRRPTVLLLYSRSAAVIFVELVPMIWLEVQRTGNIISSVRCTSFFLFCYGLQILPPRCGCHTKERIICASSSGPCYCFNTHATNPLPVKLPPPPAAPT